VYELHGASVPAELRRSLACTNIIENMMGTVRRVTRNVEAGCGHSVGLKLGAPQVSLAAVLRTAPANRG